MSILQFLRLVSWSYSTTCTGCQYRSAPSSRSASFISIRFTFSSSSFSDRFTSIVLRSRLLRNCSPTVSSFLLSSPFSLEPQVWPMLVSTLKLGESLEEQKPVFQLQQLRSVCLGISIFVPSKYCRKSSDFSRCAQSMYPDISSFCLPSSTRITRMKIIVSIRPFSTFSSRSASARRKGQGRRLTRVLARAFVLSLCWFCLASSIARFLASNSSRVRISVLTWQPSSLSCRASSMSSRQNLSSSVICLSRQSSQVLNASRLLSQFSFSKSSLILFISHKAWKYSFEPTGSGFIVCAPGTQFAGQPSPCLSTCWNAFISRSTSSTLLPAPRSLQLATLTTPLPSTTKSARSALPKSGSSSFSIRAPQLRAFILLRSSRRGKVSPLIPPSLREVFIQARCVYLLSTEIPISLAPNLAKSATLSENAMSSVGQTKVKSLGQKISTLQLLAQKKSCTGPKPNSGVTT